MKTPLKLLSVLLLSASLVACSSANSDEPTATPATTEPVKAASVELYGKVVATKSTQIAIAQSLKVSALHVQNGSKVSKGDVLATLDLSALQRDKSLLELEIAQYKKQLGLDNSSYLETLQRLKDAKARSEEIKKLMNTQKQLLDQGTLTQTDYDATKRQWLQAEREIESAQVAVNSAIQLGSQTKSTVALNLAKTEASLAAIQDTLNLPWLVDNQIICLLETGIVEIVHVQEGQMVQSNMPYFTLVDTQNIAIRANASEDFLKHLSVGQSVVVTPLMDKSTQLNGKITFISAQAEQQGGETSVPVEIALEKPTDLPIKLNVDVRVPLN